MLTATREQKQSIITEALTRYRIRFCKGMWNPDNDIRDTAINATIAEICKERGIVGFRVIYTAIGIFEV